MKFTSEDLMKAMGLNVGDRVKTPNGKIYEVISEIVDSNNSIGLINKDKHEDNYLPLTMLIYCDNFEILPRPKRVGDLKCEEYSCACCPMKMICMNEIPLETSNTLYDVLDNLLDDSISDFFDQEIYDLLKARLDKEVVEKDE